MNARNGEQLVDPDLRAALAVLPDLGSLTLDNLPSVRDLLSVTAPLAVATLVPSTLTSNGVGPSGACLSE